MVLARESGNSSRMGRRLDKAPRHLSPLPLLLRPKRRAVDWRAVVLALESGKSSRTARRFWQTSEALESVTGAPAAKAPGNLTVERWFRLLSRATLAEQAGAPANDRCNRRLPSGASDSDRAKESVAALLPRAGEPWTGSLRSSER